jgi:hypothetical protein
VGMEEKWSIAIFKIRGGNTLLVVLENIALLVSALFKTTDSNQ